MALWYHHGEGCKKDILKSIILYSEAVSYENQGSLTNLDMVIRKILTVKYGLDYVMYAIEFSENPVWILLELVRNYDKSIYISKLYNVPDQNIFKTINELNPGCFEGLEEEILNCKDVVGEWTMWSSFCDILIYDYKLHVLGNSEEETNEEETNEEETNEEETNEEETNEEEQ